MRQEYLTTGFPIIIVSYITAASKRERAKEFWRKDRHKETDSEREKKKKENCLRIFSVYKYLYTHYPSLCAVGFFLSPSSIYMQKKAKKTAFFSRFVHVLWEDNRACLSYFVELQRENQTTKEESQNNTTAIGCVVFVIVRVSNKKQRVRRSRCRRFFFSKTTLQDRCKLKII